MTPRFPDLTADGLIGALGTACEVYVSGCAAEIVALPDMLGNRLAGATITSILSPLVNVRSYASPHVGRRCRTFFLNAEVKKHLDLGVVDLCPWSYSQIAYWLAHRAAIDAVVVMVTPPDADGFVSLGVQTDFFPLFRHRVGKLIAVVNPQMPRTMGMSRFPLSGFAAVFAIDQPLLSPPEAHEGDDPEIKQIASHVANMIPDGATIQLGLGKVSQSVARGLVNHKALGVVSGLVDDNILTLEGLGVLDRTRPILTGAAIGSRALYEALNGNERFCFSTTAETHGLDSLLGHDRFYSVNTTLQVDLFGQINSELVNGRMISTPGGFPDFLRAATMNPTGRGIVTVRARGGAKTAPGIVTQMTSPAGVSAAKTDVDVVVTEFGVAEVRFLTLDARAEALIAIAAPEDRDRLQGEWDMFRRGGRPAAVERIASA